MRLHAYYFILVISVSPAPDVTNLFPHKLAYPVFFKMADEGRNTDLNFWIKLLSCIIEANGGHIGLSHINLHWYN